METQVHTVTVTLDWGLLAAVSKLDRFDASWAAIERREGQILKQLSHCHGAERGSFDAH